MINLDRIEATRIRASNEAYDLRALTGNISRVIEEDLPAVVEELREARERIAELETRWADLSDWAADNNDPALILQMLDLEGAVK